MIKKSYFQSFSDIVLSDFLVDGSDEVRGCELHSKCCIRKSLHRKNVFFICVSIEIVGINCMAI